MEKGFNLIQQLQETPKWKEFEEWYNNYYLTNKHVPSLNTLEQVPYDMYRGVFEKFIESRGCNAITWVGEYQIEYCLHAKGYVAGKDFSTFEELLIWYFNN